MCENKEELKIILDDLIEMRLLKQRELEWYNNRIKYIESKIKEE